MRDGILWFTGQAGLLWIADPASGEIEVFAAPRGRGPYGITVTPDNRGVLRIVGRQSHCPDRPLQRGTPRFSNRPLPSRARGRVWSDSAAIVWVSEWEAGQVAAYDHGTGGPGGSGLFPVRARAAYAVYVDETDRVWLTDFTRQRRDRAIRPGHRDIRFVPAAVARAATFASSSAAPVRSGAPNPPPTRWW